MTASAPRRILVTGADGFVGRHLLPVLRRDFPDADLHLARFDLRDDAAIAASIREVLPDVCVHLAAVAAIPAAQSNPDAAWHVNLYGTLSLARALATEAPGCTMLFASTSDAYGRSFLDGEALDEDAALNPMNVYGATKAAADLALGAMSHGPVHIIRARPFNHIGPGQTTAFAIPAFARQIALIMAGRQPPVVRVGALDARRDFLDVRDVCACYARILSRRNDLPNGTVLNIASGTPRTIGSVLDDLVGLAGIDIRREVDKARLRPTEIQVAAGDATKAQRLLGWAPVIPWRQTLSDVLADWQTRIAADPT